MIKILIEEIILNSLKEAFDHRNKKLNKVEQLKQRKSPKDVLAQLQEYSITGYDSIAEEDLDFFLKSYGIFDRKEPNSFMMRVRVPNGKLTYAQAKVIGEVAQQYGQNLIDITTRMQFQLRHIRIEDIPDVLEMLDSVGLSPFQTGVDNIRNIVSDPLNGVAKDSVIQTDHIVKSLQEIFLKKDEWISVLPRKLNVGINGSFANRSNIFGQDIAFVLAQKDGEFGFNLYLGGKVGESAIKTDIFVKDEKDILALFTTVIELFKEFGFRDNRNKNRLFYLIQSVGLQKFEQAIRKRCNVQFQQAGKSLVDFENFNNERVELSSGQFAQLLIIPTGRMTGSNFIELSEALHSVGGELRLTYEQNIYVVGVERDSLQDIEIVQKYIKFNTPFYKNMVACAGSEDCSFGVIPNKPDAIDMAEYLSEKLTTKDDYSIRFHWSACPKGCGLHGIGDIGFEGTKVKVDGITESGVHIFLGGKMGADAKEGYKVFKGIRLPYAKLYVSDIIRLYEKMRLDYESFSQFEKRVLSNYSPYALEFFFRFNRLFPEVDSLQLKENPKSSKEEVFEIFDFGVEIYKSISGIEPYLNIRNFTSNSRSNPKPLNHSISKIVQKMIERDPYNRYQAFSEIFADIDRL